MLIPARPQIVIAEREVARYVYQRTGRTLGRDLGGIVVGTKDDSRLDRNTWKEAAKLKPQQYLLKRGSNRFYIIGGDPLGALYGAYRFVEHLGVRFYLHGDTLPDKRIPFALPKIHEVGKPIFVTRGIQPFHDFPEGPDWWNHEDLLAVVSQLPKLRMNFIGFHCYPEGGAGPEPLVWIGSPDDLNPDGTVRRSPSSWWASTDRDGPWGYKATLTSSFAGGAGLLFPEDHFGPDVLSGVLPRPKTNAENNTVFERSARMFNDAFTLSRLVGVKTCVGTETPLTIPKDTRPNLSVEEAYRGIFTRIRKQMPADYYWLWTPEDWTWSGNTKAQLDRTVGDIQTAERVLKELKSPMKLATSGWVLGPQDDRSLLDRMLPKTMAMSSINRNVGHSPVDPSYAEIHGRPKWAIPWMENDPTLTAPQLWVGRMQYDAADSARLGCDGLLGIHWRTRQMAPNVSALAHAAWEQPWKSTLLRSANPIPGGNTSSFDAPVAGTDHSFVYQTVRYGMSRYEIALPNGPAKVTLEFNEPYYGEAGKRVFGVTLQGKQVIESLDMFARGGRNVAQDFSFDTQVTDGKLRLGFVPIVEYPCIAGIVVRSGVVTKRIDCGGPGGRGYSADNKDADGGLRTRSMPVQPFYLDFARSEFGPEVAGPVAAFLTHIDGINLPQPTAWIKGPGNIAINNKAWSDERVKWRFIDQLRSLRSKVNGPGNIERFDYWLNTFEAARCMAKLGCTRGRQDAEIARGDLGAAKQTRAEMISLWTDMMRFLVQTVSSPGELGTIANLEQNTRGTSQFLTSHDDLLGPPPPLETTYRGHPTLNDLSRRTCARDGEVLKIRYLSVGAGQPVLHYRAMGGSAWLTRPCKHLGRAVYEATLPPVTERGLEYYVSAGKLRCPATAPTLNRTVILLPAHLP